MRLRTGLLAALLALAGCGDEDHNPQDFTASLDKTSTSADDSAVTPAPVVPARRDTLPRAAPPQVTLALALAPLGRATVRGSGQAQAVGKATSVSLALAQAVAGATYEGAIRQGSCRGMGAAIASLFPVSADSLGAGSASSDVPIPIDSLTGAPHVVVYGRGGRPEACAPLGAGSAPAPPTATPPPPGAVPSVSDAPAGDTTGRTRR